MLSNAELFLPVAPFVDPTLDLITDANEPRFLDEGRAILTDALKATRLVDAFREKRLKDDQRKRALFGLVLGGIGEFRSLAKLLVNGAMSIGRWFRSMFAGVVSRDYAAGMVGVEDDDPHPADLTTIRREANEQAAYLVGFREALKSGRQSLDGAENRAELYASAAWGLAERVRQALFVRNGYSQGQRILGVSDHCAECVYEAGRGWVEIGSVRPIGTTVCGSRCHCSVSFR